MLNNRKLLFIVLPLVFGGLIFGIIKLFQLRFESGDVYAHYSTLRADPLGTRALYESLERLPHVSVRRLHDRLFKSIDGSDTTMFVLGVDVTELRWTTETEAKDLETFVRSGGRMIVSLYPENTKTWSTRRKEKKEEQEKKEEGKTDKSDKPSSNKSEAKDKKKKKSDHGGTDEDDLFLKMVSLTERWDFKIAYEDLITDDKGISQPVDVTRNAEFAPAELPPTISWHSAIYFSEPGKAWKAIYNRGEHTVVMERQFGKGTLVLISDSYFFSNEALRKERYPAVLAWLAGPNGHLAFDEAHLGVVEDPGIAGLIRKYRLHGFVVGLFILAALFVWQNSVSFIPPHEEDFIAPTQSVAGKDSAAGFVNLLRRSISPTQLISVCLAEWKKSCARHRRDLQRKSDRIDQLVAQENARPARERNATQLYQSIARLLAERK